MAHPVGGLELLGRPQILFDFGAVIDDDAGLQLARGRDKLLGLPIVLALALHPGLVAGAVVAGVGEVEPQYVDLAIVGQQLSHLIAHVLGVLVHVAVLALLVSIGIFAARVQHVDREIRMMPVDQRVVEAYMQTLGAERIHVFAYQIAARGGVGALVIGVLAVEHAEALVVLGGQHRVLHAGGFGLARPCARIEQVGIKVLEVLVVLLFRYHLAGLNPLVAGGHGVQAPVDEHAEAVAGEPCGVAGSFARYITGHRIPPIILIV